MSVGITKSIFHVWTCVKSENIWKLYIVAWIFCLFELKTDAFSRTNKNNEAFKSSAWGTLAFIQCKSTARLQWNGASSLCCANFSVKLAESRPLSWLLSSANLRQARGKAPLLHRVYAFKKMIMWLNGSHLTLWKSLLSPLLCFGSSGFN